MVAAEVWVLVEHLDGKLLDGCLEVVGEGRVVADKLDRELAAVVLGELPADQIALLGNHGARRVLSIEHPALGERSIEIEAQVLAAAIERGSPEVVLSVHSVNGADLAGRLAARLTTGLVTCCDRVDVGEDGRLTATKPVYGNKASATFVCPGGRPQMATINPDAIDLKTPDPGASAGVVTVAIDIEPDERKTYTVEFLKGDPRLISLSEAEVVVAGGMGLGSAENFRLVERLADVIGGSVGATRRAVDEDWVASERQIGLTGKTVRPKLYIACGISGAIQHTMGMKDARAIVAINTDRSAPIFKIADVGVVGDVLAVLPVLTARVQQILGDKAKPGADEVLDAISRA